VRAPFFASSTRRHWLATAVWLVAFAALPCRSELSPSLARCAEATKAPCKRTTTRPVGVGTIPNLATIKAQIRQYHESGRYIKDVAAVAEKAQAAMERAVQESSANNGGKLAVVFDIDETLLSNYPWILENDFGVAWHGPLFKAYLGKDPGLEPTIRVVRRARQLGLYVVLITGRPDAVREGTIANLKKVDCPYDLLVTRDKDELKLLAEVYKTAHRKKITEEGYRILINVGDQQSDLVGGYADQAFKIPNAMYYIP